METKTYNNIIQYNIICLNRTMQYGNNKNKNNKNKINKV